jgi:hypothetical protein
MSIAILEQCTDMYVYGYALLAIVAVVLVCLLYIVQVAGSNAQPPCSLPHSLLQRLLCNGCCCSITPVDFLHAPGPRGEENPLFVGCCVGAMAATILASAFNGNSEWVSILPLVLVLPLLIARNARIPKLGMLCGALFSLSCFIVQSSTMFCLVSNHGGRAGAYFGPGSVCLLYVFAVYARGTYRAWRTSRIMKAEPNTPSYMKYVSALLTPKRLIGTCVFIYLLFRG